MGSWWLQCHGQTLDVSQMTQETRVHSFFKAEVAFFRGRDHDKKKPYELTTVSKGRDMRKWERKDLFCSSHSVLRLSPCVVYYLLLLCFCPTSSAHTRCANNTPAKLIGNTHIHTLTHKHTNRVEWVPASLLQAGVSTTHCCLSSRSFHQRLFSNQIKRRA